MNKEKIYILEGLDCANCAAKMESKIQELPGIHEANLVFATKQLKIVADDPDSLVPQMQKICSKNGRCDFHIIRNLRPRLRDDGQICPNSPIPVSLPVRERP